LLSEAKTQANIHLDCIPQIYDTFEWNKRICIVMQWIKGVSLREILDNFPTINYRYRIADSLINAIADLHEQGFAHRDLKPENVLISPENGVFLVDFGFTKSVIDGKKSLSGTIKGTPAYMAPELWGSNTNINPLRTDLFSLGKILKEMFLNETEHQSIINSLLEENPDRRPESAREFCIQWNAIATELVPGLATWHQIAGNVSSLRHSRKLLTAARELLYANRDEESYWLLVECLEEDPEYEEAIEFMRKFPQSSKKKKKRNQIIKFSALTILILLIILSYFAGRMSLKKDYASLVLSPTQHKHSSQLLTSRSDSSNILIARLLEDTLKSASLKGRIIIQNYPEKGIFSIDDSLRDTTNFKSGIECLYGIHTLSWKNDSGLITWKEKVNILPFQKKYISIK
jgi:serine/threonine protein kinase